MAEELSRRAEIEGRLLALAEARKRAEAEERRWGVCGAKEGGGKGSVHRLYMQCVCIYYTVQIMQAVHIYVLYMHAVHIDTCSRVAQMPLHSLNPPSFVSHASSAMKAG